MIIWIATRYVGYEGHSEPLQAFSTEDKANIFKAGAEATYCDNIKIYPLTVDALEKGKENDQ